MTTTLIETTQALVAGDRGLLAIDESIATCNARFAALGIAQTEPSRRAYRELLVTAPALGESISGAILCDETIRQRTADEVPFTAVLAEAGILVGIKVDRGATAMAGHPGEKITEGLDGLRERLTEYAELGARFAKWRAVFLIGDHTPSSGCLNANAHALARYAALCQEAGLVPIVEPEVLMDGRHTVARCAEVTDQALRAVFGQLHDQGVTLEAMVLKPNMVLAGSTCPEPASAEAVADATLACLTRVVPPAVGAIAFLSGGQSGDEATARLEAINRRWTSRPPWALSFSFGRAVQQPCLQIWNGRFDRVAQAQRALLQRAADNRAARSGGGGAPSQGGTSLDR